MHVGKGTNTRQIVRSPAQANGPPGKRLPLPPEGQGQQTVVGAKEESRKQTVEHQANPLEILASMYNGYHVRSELGGPAIPKGHTYAHTTYSSISGTRKGRQLTVADNRSTTCPIPA